MAGDRLLVAFVDADAAAAEGVTRQLMCGGKRWAEIVNVPRRECRVIRRRVQKAGFGAQLPSITSIMPDSTLRNPSISCWTKVQYTAAAARC